MSHKMIVVAMIMTTTTWLLIFLGYVSKLVKVSRVSSRELSLKVDDPC
jgi:hypothetical protein